MVASDTSDTGISPVILHKFKDGKMKPTAHPIRTLLAAENKYSQIEKETLRIIFAVKNSIRWRVAELYFTKGPPSVIQGLVWFVCFYGISTFVGYLTPNPFLCK